MAKRVPDLLRCHTRVLMACRSNGPPGFQMAMHNIHSEIYSMLIESFVKVPAERDMLLNAVTEMPCCRKKTDWFVAPAAAGYQ
eukprot:SAG11_NODE_2480_length_3307_cov_3.206983_3_plen_83_part_00